MVDFLVVGAMKSGTTTLTKLMKKHPNIYMPERELHFFYKKGMGNLKKGEEWYKKHFINAGKDRIKGEKCPAYSYVADTPKNIADIVGNVKLVWVLRDPVDRVYSNYWHAVNSGIEPYCLEKAIDKEIENKRSVWKCYIERSKYDWQIRNYLKYHDLNDMYFCKTKDIEKEDLIQRVYSFLGLRRYKIEQAKIEHANKTYIPFSIKTRYYTNQYFGETSIVRKLERKINKRERGYKKNKRIDKKIYNEVKESIESTEEITGLDLSNWKRYEF